MGEARRRKVAGDYPVANVETPKEIQAPGRRVVVVGNGMNLMMLAALMASEKNESLEVHPQ